MHEKRWERCNRLVPAHLPLAVQLWLALTQAVVGIAVDAASVLGKGVGRHVVRASWAIPVPAVSERREVSRFVLVQRRRDVDVSKEVGRVAHDDDLQAGVDTRQPQRACLWMARCAR